MKLLKRGIFQRPIVWGISLMKKCYVTKGGQWRNTEKAPADVTKMREIKSNYNVLDYCFDTIVVGTGGAGLRAAVELSKKGFKTAVITKQWPTRSHTVAAQGGINAALCNMDEDDWLYHFYDTVKSSDWLGDQDAIHFMCREAPRAIYELENYGMPFSRTDEGKIYQRGFGGQTLNCGTGGPAHRACCVADNTGHALLHCLYGQCLACENCCFFVEHFVFDVLFENCGCVGVMAWNLENGAICRFRTYNTIIATGGSGRCYFSCTESHTSTGDGTAMLARKGLPLQDMEFVQFHPTGLYGVGCLITEGVRDIGGLLHNSMKERFMERYAPESKEMATRDIVARAMAKEILDGKGCGPERDYIHLQLHHIGREVIEKRLPGIKTTAMTFANIDITKEPVPVVPTMHYSMGGIPTNYKGQVLTLNEKNEVEVVPGLYACGECACVSVHGANRMGGNSLLDIIVFGKVCAETISECTAPGCLKSPLKETTGFCALKYFHNLRTSEGQILPAQLLLKLQKTMSRHAGVFREGGLLLEGCHLIKQYLEEFKNIKIEDKSLIWNSNLVEAMELHNLLVNAFATIVSMENREESRGSHYREDYKERIDECNYAEDLENQQKKSLDEHWRKHTLIWMDSNGKTQIKYRPVTDKVLDDTIESIPPAPRTY